MKPIKRLSFLLAPCLACLAMITPAAAQTDSSARDTSISIPFPDLPIENIRAIGNKKTGTLVISMDFVNKVKDKFVQVALDFGGPASFVFATEKGPRFTVHTYYNDLYEKNPNAKYSKVKHIKFGDDSLWLATSVRQQIDTGESRKLVITLPGFDKTSKEIREFAVHCDYTVRYDRKGTGFYKIAHIPIVWKEEEKKVQPVKKNK
ncbi:MAG: hypothetical protein ACTHMC_17775 [Pseudobacter sp.]|uniref:hypothetical protein n=1 Tax=Pseudobacter sp. TaxID=2045420 RepID=UPI003F7F0868